MWLSMFLFLFYVHLAEIEFFKSLHSRNHVLLSRIWGAKNEDKEKSPGSVDITATT